ncbi:NHL repeat-containing protein [Lignipirellula cremea]|uniref:NHL repeat protein n=1 Tax=Lignipirellula cremea TaxID=2528010 RepID=A0A518DUA9_9BACT|nr:hypothetical protein [Lignipirellula cremea]QDU95419.1 hypothetical protein Pla8534_32340 [Lignipirellula cremea]
MRYLLAITFLLGGTALASGETPVAFSAKPVVQKNATGMTIDFTLSARADVEVAIVNGQGRVVRHLAAGVIGGKNAAPAPFIAGLSQSVAWDRRDDYGEPVDGDCTARVRAGMGTKIDRIVGGDPYAFYSQEMGQGDHAAWRLTGLEAKSDGKVYLLANANNYGPAALRQYEADGSYCRTVYPPPAGLKQEQVAGWGSVPADDGTYRFQYNDLDSPAITTSFLSGNRGRIASLLPSPHPDELLLTRDFELLKVHTDGSLPEHPQLTGRLVNQPAMEPDVKNPRLGPWRLSGPLHTCNAPDGEHFYLSGVFAGATDNRGSRIGASPDGFWRDGQVYRVDYATRTAEVFFALDPKQVITDLKERTSSPIADAKYGEYAALQGVAVDGSGRVFVCDRQNQRLLVLDADGKQLREIPLAYPDMIAVSPNSQAIYVTTRTGHFHDKGELTLHKFADWSKDAKPVASMPLCEVRFYGQRTHLAVAESAGKVFVWVAYTSLPVRVFEDSGTDLKLVKDFYEAGPQRALDLQHMAVDPETGNALIADGFDRCFQLSDWENPRFERIMQDENTPVEGLSLAIDSRHRWLYTHGDREPICRFHLDRKYFSPAPPAGSQNGSALTDKLSSDWRIGLGHGDRGIAVARDGSFATLAALGTGPDYGGYLRYYPANSPQTPWEGLLLTAFGEKVKAAGVRFDLQGNLYAGKIDGPPTSPPVGYERDANYQQSTGRIYRFAPTGSFEKGNLFPTEPVAAAKVYDVDFGMIGPRFARTPRFTIDGFGRIYYPAGLLSQVAVIDNEGNPIHRFGAYGNRDSLGGLAGDLVPTVDIPLAMPSSVDATDDYIYVTDIVNIRLLRIAKTFAASESVRIP